MDVALSSEIELSGSGHRAPRRVVLYGALVGGVVGMAYGIALRSWMRFVSDDPEFSWTGTIFIIGAFTVTSALAGLVVGGRRRGWKALLLVTRVVAIVVSLSCFLGAGLLMLPTVVLGALAVSRIDWPRAVRLGVAAISALSVLAVVAEVGDRAQPRATVIIVSYLALVFVEIRIFAEPYRPTVSRVPTACRVLAAGAAAVISLGAIVMAAGV